VAVATALIISFVLLTKDQVFQPSAKATDHKTLTQALAHQTFKENPSITTKRPAENTINTRTDHHVNELSWIEPLPWRLTGDLLTHYEILVQQARSGNLDATYILAMNLRHCSFALDTRGC